MSNKFIINYNSILSIKNNNFQTYSSSLKEGYDKINSLQDKFNYDNYLNYAWKQVVTKFDEIISKRDSIDDWWTNYLENIKVLENQLPDNLNFNIVKVETTKYFIDHSSIIVNTPLLNDYISSHRTGEIVEQVEDTSSSSPITYVVQKGDNLSKIARMYGLTWQDIYNANRGVIGSNPNLIYPGQSFVIPGSSGGSSYSGYSGGSGSGGGSTNNSGFNSDTGITIFTTETGAIVHNTNLRNDPRFDQSILDEYMSRPGPQGLNWCLAYEAMGFSHEEVLAANANLMSNSSGNPSTSMPSPSSSATNNNTAPKAAAPTSNDPSVLKQYEYFNNGNMGAASHEGAKRHNKTTTSSQIKIEPGSMTQNIKNSNNNTSNGVTIKPGSMTQTILNNKKNR